MAYAAASSSISSLSSSSSSSSLTPKMVFTNLQTESTFDQIPVINFTDATSSDPALRKALAEKMRDACVNVMNHGIPEDVITGAVEAGKKFFAMDMDSKMNLDIHKTENFKGYTTLLGENTDPNGRGDLHEGFDIGWEEPSQSPSKSNPEPGSDGAISNPSRSSRGDDGSAMLGTNVWPDLPGFKDPVLKYYHAVIKLGLSLFPLFALALDLPENFFEDKTTKPAAIMRLLHYPPQTPISVSKDDGKVLGIGAHTDYECFTILWQDTISALQVQNTEGRWIDAVPIPGTFVLNIGDQLARWTNDVFKSTMHRAINESGKERYSMPLFYGVDYDVLLEPISTCVSPEMPAKYEVVTAGEYVKRRLEETYAHSAVGAEGN